MNATRTIRCEPLDCLVTLPVKPRRVVCLVSGWTEALDAMGLLNRIAGVSKYCARYVNTTGLIIVGDYLRIDEAALDALNPDLILLTGGVQLGIARRLSKAGRPVYVLPLADSFAGIIDNIRKLGALMGEMSAAHSLTARMETEATALRASVPTRRPRIYTELWFGRHPRMAGGLTFIHDLIELAGGQNLFADLAEGYPKLDLAAVAAARPDVIVLFHEEDDHSLDVATWRCERDWDTKWNFSLIESGITRGQNMIHDGPSILTTAHWLRQQLPQ